MQILIASRRTQQPSIRRRRVAAMTVMAMAFLSGGAASSPIERTEPELVDRLKAAGLADGVVTPRDDGGRVMDGSLGGDQVALAIPRSWNGDVVLFAHGYSVPGSSVAVPKDPVSGDPSQGLLAHAFARGFAVGYSAYNKAGLGVESATMNTKRLRDAFRNAGARRIYITGGSMGGNIVLSSIERFPDAYAGAVSLCGVTDGWESQFGGMVDMRAVYNLLTRETPYALPGNQDITASALSTGNDLGDGAAGDLFRAGQMKRLATPILALFKAAQARPDGREAAIIRQVSALSGYTPDVASFVLPLVTVALGMDDMRATWGGMAYGNRNKRYASAGVTDAEAAFINAHVQRLAADPAAVVKARAWHQTIGVFKTPLVSVHNQIDPLVPLSQATGLSRILRRTGNTRALQYTVPAVVSKLPIGDVTGYTHCGFSKQQLSIAFDKVTAWVETGRVPSPQS